MSRLQILTGDCRDILPTLEAESVQCCVTSPPYWGLRDYGTAQWEGGDAECDHTPTEGSNSGRPGRTFTASPPYRVICPKCGARRIDSQLGLEATPDEYIANMVAVFREVKRVLRDDGTCWINLGDSYAGSSTGGFRPGSGRADGIVDDRNQRNRNGNGCPAGLKPKDLCMMPARLAMALQADGWYLRSEIVWHKPNPMPESVTDRPTKAHEMIYLLAKQERYFYDAEAIREPQSEGTYERFGKNPILSTDRKCSTAEASFVRSNLGFRSALKTMILENGRNKRSVWTIPTQPYAEAHFATFPEDLIKPCILAGSKPGDTVLDPFAGSGTTGRVALELGRKAILIELNPAYIELAEDRTFVTPGFL